MDLRLSLICIFLIVFSGHISGQKVTVSNEISIRNNILYNIIGRVEDKILFYRDKGNQREIMLYDNDLVFQSERQINLDEKRCRLYDVINLDTAFAVLYGYRRDGKDLIKMDIFSSTASLLDSTVLLKLDKDWRNAHFKTVTSEDRSKIALYDIENTDKIRILIIDVNQQKTILRKEYFFESVNLYDEVDQLLISNEGAFFVLAQKYNIRNRKKDHVAHVYKISPGREDVLEITVPLNDVLCQDLMITLNNDKNKIGMAGLYHEKKRDESTGYFWVSGDISNFGSQELVMVPFDEEIFFEVYGERNKKRLENFRVTDVFWKSNSTPIIVLEMAFDINRRTGTFSTMELPDDYRSRRSSRLGWSDHYREDMILISLKENGEKDWHQVFYKRQFSQNDDAVFSSFYPFITPSRLRLIYNDEIKPNSTVSEYVLDAHGNYKRTSVLSTEYQDLKLRFSDANQISPTELLVPSHNNYDINIVKIDFGN